MPSVRLKRESGYATLRDSIPDRELPSPRPRSRSLAGVFQLQDSGTPQSHNLSISQTVSPENARQRSQTVSTRRGSLRNSVAPTHPMGRVSAHIVSRTRVPVASSDDRSDRGGSLLTGARRSLSLRSHRSRTSMLSLEGPRENILIPEEEGREPGRIGYALGRASENLDDPFDEHHHDDIVEHLDVIDPQIATVSMLANAANSIVIPPLSLYSRKPVIVLSSTPAKETTSDGGEKGPGVCEDNLDRHVEEILRKRDKFKRVMRGVWSFLKTPMGIIVGIYGFLIVFWGSGIVLFLAKIINLHNENQQGYWVELCQQVETGLFSATSIGLIPFRVMDTYRVYKIWFYKRRTRILREKAGLPQLYDVDDLPDPIYDDNYVHVLTEKEQADLHYHQYKFSQSQTWYRPHGTQTHRAFPINIALTICIMNDLNSFFQCLLSACMWSMDRFERPAWTTATTLPAAFVAGILAGVFIWWGGKKTKRHEEVEKRLRSVLAMNPMEEASPKPSDNPTIVVSGAPTGHSTAEATLVLPEGEPCGRDLSSLETRKRPFCRDRIELANITPRVTSVIESVASIPISDSMSVPPATVFKDAKSRSS